MSADELTELNGMGRYFEFNAEQTQNYENQFDENHQFTVKGDGTSRISIFYDRKEITQRFFYGRKTDDGKYQILGKTKGFSSIISALSTTILPIRSNRTYSTADRLRIRNTPRPITIRPSLRTTTPLRVGIIPRTTSARLIFQH